MTVGRGDQSELLYKIFSRFNWSSQVDTIENAASLGRSFLKPSLCLFSSPQKSPNQDGIRYMKDSPPPRQVFPKSKENFFRHLSALCLSEKVPQNITCPFGKKNIFAPRVFAEPNMKIKCVYIENSGTRISLWETKT